MAPPPRLALECRIMCDAEGRSAPERSDGHGPDGSAPAGSVPVVHGLTDDVLLVRVGDGISAEAAAQLRQSVYAQLARGPRLVIVDLRPLSRLSPDGVSALVDIACEAGAGDIGLCLVCGDRPGDPVPLALHGAGVASLFEIHPDQGAALGTLD
jgi:anti-anti-sigma regulatory factor